MATSERAVRLLDANVLVALSLANHAHHAIVTRWFEGVDDWATCSITEAAYCRLLLNPRVTGFELSAGEVMHGLKAFCSIRGHRFVEDSASLASPSIDFGGLIGYRQVTDLHLVDLAAREAMVLATLDARISASLAKADRRFVEVIPLD